MGSPRPLGPLPSSRRAENAPLILIGVGGALFAVSPFLPWVNIVFLGNLNLLNLTAQAHSIAVLPSAMSLVGFGITVSAVARVRVAPLSLIVGAIVGTAILLGGGDLSDLIVVVDRTRGLISLGLGFYAAIGGLILLLVGAVKGRATSWNYPSASEVVPRPIIPAPPGWYEDPSRSGHILWWNGHSWTPKERPSPDPSFSPHDCTPGWKADPWRVGQYRYWDGASWTRHLA